MLGNFDLRQKKVLDADTAEVLGYIRDMDIDFQTGRINSVTVPRRGIVGIIGAKRCITVPWENVVAMGREYILVKTTK